MTQLQSLAANSGTITQISENFDAVSPAGIFGKRAPGVSGLTWGFYGGLAFGNVIADDVVTLAASATNYVVANRATGVVTSSTSDGNWTDTENYFRCYVIVTGATSITSAVDHREFLGGAIAGGGSTPTVGVVPQNSQSSAYTLLASDAGKHLLHPSADTSSRTWTIPSNASVPMEIGTAITFVNQNGAGNITIAITTDAMRLAGDGSLGSRSLAPNGIATALKITATEWLISGTNLT